jgi:flavodoxin
MRTNCLSLLLAILATVFGAQAQTIPVSKKILVVYFSHSGNTRAVARQIHAKVGGDIFEIQTIKPYPTDYNILVEQAKQELKSDYRPELKSRLKNVRQYDLIFLGYPDWWGTYPQAVKVFLSECDFSGKTIVPFCTHGGSEFGRSLKDLAKMSPKSTILQGLAIRDRELKSSQNKIIEWLHELKFIK